MFVQPGDVLQARSTRRVPSEPDGRRQMILDLRSIDAVVLDAGGVLVVPGPVVFRRLLAPYGAAPDDATCLRAHYEGMREVDRLKVPPRNAGSQTQS